LLPPHHHHHLKAAANVGITMTQGLTWSTLSPCAGQFTVSTMHTKHYMAYSRRRRRRILLSQPNSLSRLKEEKVWRSPSLRQRSPSVS